MITLGILLNLDENKDSTMNVYDLSVPGKAKKQKSNLQKLPVLLSVIFLCIINLFYMQSSYAITVVNAHSCQRMHGVQRPFLLVIKRGDDINQTITQCANAARLPGAILMGIGAIKDPTLAYFNLTTKKYQNKTFAGIYELLSLNGNISQVKGKRFVHDHVVIGDDQYHTFGGHLMGGTVGVTAEIAIIPLSAIPKRVYDKDTHLSLIKPN